MPFRLVCQGPKTAFSVSKQLLRADKRKTPQSIGITTFLASWKGLEPPACRLGGDRSIQLSYQDVYEIVCQIVKDVRALMRLALYPAELRRPRRACVCHFTAGGGKTQVPFGAAVTPPGKCKTSDNPSPARSRGWGGPAPAAGPPPAGAPPPRPPRPPGASGGKARPS